MPIHIDMVPYVKPGVVIRPMRAMLDLLLPGTTTGLTLNPEARAFFERIDGRRSVASIARSMIEVYDAPLELLIKEASEVMGSLADAGIIGWESGDEETADVQDEEDG